jgi:hypothetical protein
MGYLCATVRGSGRPGGRGGPTTKSHSGLPVCTWLWAFPQNLPVDRFHDISSRYLICAHLSPVICGRLLETEAWVCFSCTYRHSGDGGCGLGLDLGLDPARFPLMEMGDMGELGSALSPLHSLMLSAMYTDAVFLSGQLIP